MVVAPLPAPGPPMTLLVDWMTEVCCWMTGVEVVEAADPPMEDEPGRGSGVLPLDQQGGEAEGGGLEGDREMHLTSVSVPFTISINCRTFNIKRRLWLLSRRPG